MDQTLITGEKESGETHAKVVSHDGMLSCQSDLFLLWRKTTEYLYNASKHQLLKKRNMEEKYELAIEEAAMKLGCWKLRENQ